jgi:hypothetical protein
VVAAFVMLGALAAASTAASATSATRATVAKSTTAQVYHAGTATSPSTAVPRCTSPNTPPGCYKGPLLKLQAASIGQTAAEPSIGVGPDGTAYFSGSTLVIDTSVVWGVAKTDARRSTDGGKTWTSIQPSVGPAGGYPQGNADPEIYVDPVTGRVFTFDLTAACQFLSYSDDKGASWISNPLACGDVPVDHQTIVSSKPVAPITTVGYPDLLTYCSNRIVFAGCGRSFDGGINWLAGGPAYQGVDSGGNLCSSLTGHLAADPNGLLYLPSAHCGFPEIAVSTDSATTWKDVTVSTMPSDIAHTSVTTDSAGNVYYLFEGKDALPYLSISKDHGDHWTAPIMVAPPGVLQVNFPVVTAADPGHIAISFPSTTETGASRAWNYTVAVSTNALSAKPVFVSNVANAATDPIHRGDCYDRCAGMWDFIDIHISAAGQAWASASDDCTGACDTGTLTQDHVGKGIAVRQISGPKLRKSPSSVWPT